MVLIYSFLVPKLLLGNEIVAQALLGHFARNMLSEKNNAT